MKTTVSTCQPAGEINYRSPSSSADDAVWYAQAVAAGAEVVREGVLRWCNAHVGILGTKDCQRAAIVVDDEHPQYGTPATLVYPQDRYPWVVVGGSQSGHHLFVAPVEYRDLPMVSPGSHNGYPVNDRTYSSEECLAHVRFNGATRITRKQNGQYTDHGTPFALGIARYRRDWSD